MNPSEAYKAAKREQTLRNLSLPPIRLTLTKNSNLRSYSRVTSLPGALNQQVIQDSDTSFPALAGYDVAP